MTAPSPSIFSSWADHCWRVRCCSVMRLVLWHEVQVAFTLACAGPGGSGLPGALGACAPARTMDANRKNAGNIRLNMVSELDVLLVCGRCYFFVLVCPFDPVAVLGAA